MSDSPDLDATAAALRLAVHRLDRRLRVESGLQEFNLAQTVVLRRLREAGPLTTSELARLEGVRPQSMSATVADLVAAGLVDRRPDPNDGRATLLSLSDRAEGLILIARGAKENWLVRTIGDRLDAEEQRRLADAIGLLDRLLAP
ncbi:MarR family winged helix-turn-helix transcriptional regulator [Agromyces sp. Soil535]|uniref:MarR family winged helix-turn-helix transcriptional regulator n=1 Tax=Agromyces sp. Soil535 TaxID=1736390 RepID=UPI0006F942FF|nr:MarR family transcriptional regulator [Agromyces sp. Soil535]KRE23130.1 hypothetical protein ASG80_09805 [Agromyces sp. Soil535]